MFVEHKKYVIRFKLSVDFTCAVRWAVVVRAPHLTLRCHVEVAGRVHRLAVHELALTWRWVDEDDQGVVGEHPIRLVGVLSVAAGLGPVLASAGLAVLAPGLLLEAHPHDLCLLVLHPESGAVGHCDPCPS